MKTQTNEDDCPVIRPDLLCQNNVSRSMPKCKLPQPTRTCHSTFGKIHKEHCISLPNVAPETSLLRKYRARARELTLYEQAFGSPSLETNYLH